MSLNGIRVPVTLVIEMDAAQLADYTSRAGLPEGSRAKDVVASVQSRTLATVQAACGHSATVSLKGSL